MTTTHTTLLDEARGLLDDTVALRRRIHRHPEIGLTLPRPELDQRIAARVDRMWQAGLEAEVRSLAAQGLRDGKTASRALGYQQLLRYLDGEWTLDEARLETMKATRRFARRQESWFRRDPRVRWLDASQPADAVATGALGLIRPA